MWRPLQKIEEFREKRSKWIVWLALWVKPRVAWRRFFFHSRSQTAQRWRRRDLINPKTCHQERLIQINEMRSADSTSFRCQKICTISGISARNSTLTVHVVNLCHLVGWPLYFCFSLRILLAKSTCFLMRSSHVVCLVLFCVDALKDTLGLKLVGPFEILAGSHKASKSPEPNFHLHWRFYYDPPEFQTILLGNADNQHHIGYYRCSISPPVSDACWESVISALTCVVQNILQRYSGLSSSVCWRKWSQEGLLHHKDGR